MACQPGLQSTTYERALDVAKSAVNLVPDDWDGLTALSACRLRTEEYAGALASLDEAEGLLEAEGQVGGPARRAIRALLLSHLGEREGALELMRTLEGIEKEHFDSLAAGDQVLCREAIEMSNASAPLRR